MGVCEEMCINKMTNRYVCCLGVDLKAENVAHSNSRCVTGRVHQ